MMIREPDPRWPLLDTADAVIDGVGGTAAAAALTRSPIQQVSNWRRSGTMAPRTFLLFQRELASRQLRAPSMLWRIENPDQSNG